MYSFGGKNPEDERKILLYRNIKIKLQHLGSCDPPERKNSQPESSLKGKRSHIELNPVPYGKPSQVGHLYITLTPSPRALQWEAKGPRLCAGHSTWHWAVPGCPRTELGTKAIRVVFTLQSPQAQLDPQAETPYSAMASSRTAPRPHPAPHGNNCHAQQGPDTLNASTKTNEKISSWKRPPTHSFLKTQPQRLKLATAVLAMVAFNHHLNAGWVPFSLQTALPKNSWKYTDWGAGGGGVGAYGIRLGKIYDANKPFPRSTKDKKTTVVA